MGRKVCDSEAGVHLKQGIILIWGLLNTGFTVSELQCSGPCTNERCNIYIFQIKGAAYTQVFTANHCINCHIQCDNRPQVSSINGAGKFKKHF